MRNDPNKVLRITTDTVVNARDYTMVLADATSGAIALTLISPGGLSEWSIKIKNVGSGDEVTVGVAGGGSFSFVLPAGAACEVTQDDLGVLHVFGASSSSSGSSLMIPTDQSITYAADEYADDGSFQPIGPDLNLDPAAGTSDVGDSAYLATIMGNVLGDTLTKTKTIIAGLIGKFSVLGAKLSTYPWGGVVGEIGDGVEGADGAFVAVLGGDSAQTNARAAFTVDNQNSTPGSGFDYGLDLLGVDHDGYGPVVYDVADIRFSDGTTQSTAAVASGTIALETATPSTGDGIETEFVFTGIPVLVMRNGVAYSPTAFTILGTTATITVAPPDGEITALTR